MLKNIVFLFLLFLVFSCKKEDKSYSQVILNYKLFSLDVNLENNYILISRRQGNKYLSLLPPPYFEKSKNQKQNDSVSENYKKKELEWALPITKTYKFSEKQKMKMISNLNALQQKDLQGTINFPQGHCAIFNIILVKGNGEIYDVETQCYYSETQEKLKNIIFETAIEKESDSLNLAILNRSKNLKPHE